MSARVKAPPLRPDGPGARRIETSVALMRMKKDLEDRKNEKRLVDAGERAEVYLRPDAREMDPQERKTIKRLERAIESGTPDSLSRKDRGQWEAEGNRLASWLRERMVPQAGMRLRKTHDPEFQKAVRLHSSIEMSPDFVNVANRWKNIMRQLHQ